MLAVKVMRIREAAPASPEQAATAADDGADVPGGVPGLILATRFAAIGEPDTCAGSIGSLTLTERRRKALRSAYAAYLLPG